MVSAPLRLAGRSPLTRGSPGRTQERRRLRGSIPAHAGEPPELAAAVDSIRVDPRSRGGAS